MAASRLFAPAPTPPRSNPPSGPADKQQVWTLVRLSRRTSPRDPMVAAFAGFKSKRLIRFKP